MKKAAQIFMILGMIIGAFAIIPISVGILLYPYIEKAKKKSDVSFWVKLAIFVFISRIAGIILFFMSDKDFEKDNINVKKTVFAIIGIIVAVAILVTFAVIALLNAEDARIEREAPQILALLQKRDDGHFEAKWNSHYFTVTYADGSTKDGKILGYSIEKITENYVYFYDYEYNELLVYRSTHSVTETELVFRGDDDEFGLWGVLNDEEMYFKYESDGNYYIYNIADGTSEKYGHGLDSPEARKYEMGREYNSKLDEILGTNKIYKVKKLETGEIYYLPQKEIHANICANSEEMAFIEENGFYNSMTLMSKGDKLFAQYSVSGYFIYYLYDFEAEDFTYYSYTKKLVD